MQAQPISHGSAMYQYMYIRGGVYVVTLQTAFCILLHMPIFPVDVYEHRLGREIIQPEIDKVEVLVYYCQENNVDVLMEITGVDSLYF